MFLQFILLKMVSFIIWKIKRKSEKLLFFTVSENKFHVADLIIMVYKFPGPSVTNCHKCSGLKQHKFMLHFHNQKSNDCLARLKSRCQQNWSAFWGELCLPQP